MAEYESQNCPSEEAKDDYPCYGYECYDHGAWLRQLPG